MGVLENANEPIQPTGTNEVEHLLIAVKGFAGPVLGDLRKETMLDGIPFRSPCGVVWWLRGKAPPWPSG